ncbi:MAG TPA: serine hydrolase domain-containing protein [Polyangiaceae bacterium]
MATIDGQVQQAVQNRLYGPMPHYQGLAMMIVVDAGDGFPTLYYPYGTTSQAPGAPAVTATTPFGLGSVTKTFTALMAAEMSESGAMPLASKIDQYLPSEMCVGRACELPTSGTDITLVDLADFFSGLPRNVAPGDTTKAEFYNRVFHSCDDATGGEAAAVPYCPGGPGAPAGTPTDGATQSCTTPGSSYRYSNFGFSVLGNAIADQVAGLPFGDISGPSTYDAAVASLVTTPLGMSSTVTAANGTATPSGAALSYYCQGANASFECCPGTTSTEVFPDPPWATQPASWGAGGLFSNGVDMGTWMHVHLDDTRSVSIPQNVRTAIANSVFTSHGAVPGAMEQDQALAWVLDKSGSGYKGVSSTSGPRVVAEKEGDEGGYHAFVALTPRALNGGQSGHGVVVMVGFQTTSDAIQTVDAMAIDILQDLEESGL